MSWKINITPREGWVSASVENDEGDVLGESTAPVVEGATFDTPGAVIRAAVEEAIAKRAAA